MNDGFTWYTWHTINATWTVPIWPTARTAVNSEYTRDSHASRHGKLDSIPRRQTTFRSRLADEIYACDRYYVLLLLGNIE